MLFMTVPLKYDFEKLEQGGLHRPFFDRLAGLLLACLADRALAWMALVARLATDLLGWRAAKLAGLLTGCRIGWQAGSLVGSAGGVKT